MPKPDAAIATALHPRLPRFDPGEARRRAALLQRLAGRATSDGLRLYVRLDDPPPSGAALRFTGGVSAAPIVVDGRPALWTETAASAILPEALAGFSLLEPLLEVVEAALAVTLDPLGMEAAFGPGLAAQIEARDGDGHIVHAMTLVFGREAVLTPVRLSAAPVPLGVAARAGVAVRLVVEGPLAPADELARLASGDVVLAPGGPSGLRARVVLAGGRAFRGVWRPQEGRFTGEDMDDAHEAAPGDAARTQGEPLSAPGDLTVRLRFELATVELPLAEVAALAPGAVLAVPAAGNSPVVTVTAGGARLARGRLVALGDGYGVIVDEVAGVGERA